MGKYTLKQRSYVSKMDYSSAREQISCSSCTRIIAEPCAIFMSQ